MALTMLDANILLYALNEDVPLHLKAKEWIEDLFSSNEIVCLPWVTSWAFLRLATNSRVFPHPLDPASAFRIVNGWLALPNVVIVEPGPRHPEILLDLVQKGQAAGPLLSDAVLAALAIESGASLASTDRDFSRFAGLSYFNPLQ